MTNKSSPAFTLSNQNIDHICNIYNQLTSSVQNKIKERQNINTKKNKIVKTKLKFFNSLDDDQLFWYFYISITSKYDYLNLHKNKYIVEKEYKINLVTQIRKYKDILKKYKWKKSQIENNLVHDKEITLETFFCICIINKINVMYINNNTYFEINNPENTDNYVLIKKINDKYILYENTEHDVLKKMDDIRLKKWKIDNITKPLRNITTYKLPELQDIASKFNIDKLKTDGKKKTKKVLYASILEKIN